MEAVHQKFEESWEVFEEKSGMDCDGHYGGNVHEGILPLSAIYQRLGELTATYTTVVRQNNETCTIWSFSRKTEEGYDTATFGIRHKGKENE